MQLDAEFLEVFTANLFDNYGEQRDMFEVVESQKANFDLDELSWINKILKGKGSKEDKAVKPTKKILKLPNIKVLYSYEVIPGVGAEVKETTRPFCRKLCQLNKLYTRQDIEKISELVGYSVWDRRGGFWRKPDGSTSPSCRHFWMMHVVIEKTKK